MKHQVRKKRKNLKLKKKMEEEVCRAEEEMKEVDKSINGRVGNIWEMKKKIIGGEKSVMEANAIVNLQTGKLLVEKERNN